jgi:pyruvate kinase
MIKDVICTIGPSSLNKKVLLELKKEGMTIARINGSHGSVEEIDEIIKTIHNIVPDTKILLDLPGNKIRTTNVDLPISFTKGEIITLKKEMLTFPELYTVINVEEQILADDNTIILEVIEIRDTDIICKCLTDGTLKPNKGIRYNHENNRENNQLPFIFEKDMHLLDLVIKNDVDYVGTSFIRTVENVRRIKAFLDGTKVKIITKIETIDALNNLSLILKETDHIMVDRGDLSSEVGLENIAWHQNEILKQCLESNKPVIIATQLLKSMENKSLPYIAEISDITNATINGATGLMLSEETAIGKFPVESVKVLKTVANSIEKKIKNDIKVIILAAGESPGFGSLTTNKHKGMIDIGGKTIIEHQIENIKKCGIDEGNIAIVTGSHRNQIEKYIYENFNGNYKFRGNFIYNPWYKISHTAVSLSHAKHVSSKGFIILYGDIVFDWKILDKLLKHENNITIVVDQKKNLDEEDEKVLLQGDKVKHISKDLEINSCDGEFIGLAKIPIDKVCVFNDTLDKIIKKDNVMASVTEIFNNLIGLGIPLDIIYTKELLWSDNDSLNDLKYTMTKIYPYINKI